MILTVFKNNKVKNGTRVTEDWDNLIGYFDDDDAIVSPAKDAMPLIKLATFVDNIRGNKNVNMITGIEGDYDLGVIGMDEACRVLEKADFKCMIVPTARWSVEVPKWRVFAPLAQPLTLKGGWEELARRRNDMLHRINGLLGGVFSGESAVVGQCYYFGRLVGGHTEKAILLDGSRYIDECEELDADAIPVHHMGAGGGSAGTGTIKKDDLSLEDVFEDQAGQKKALREWLPLMAERGIETKIRVQTIWRVSESYAAFLRFNSDMRPVVHDMGTGISHFLERKWIGEADTLVGNTRTALVLPDSNDIMIGQETPSSTCILMTLDDMNKNLIHITSGNRYALRFRPREVLTHAEMRAMLNGNYTRVGRGQEESFLLWCSNPNRFQVSNITFLPGVGQFLRDPEGAQSLNLWLPLSRVQMRPHLAELHAELFINHVTYLFDDRAGEFMDWLAHIEQRPDVLPHTFWLHISPLEGTGRSWLASVLDRVWSPYAATGLDLTVMMEGQFNERLSGKLLAVVEEIKEGGRGAWQHNQRLKSWITEDIRLINPKGHPEYREFNRVRWLMFSNHLSAIPLSAEDRRTEVVICNKVPQPQLYYDRLYKAREEKEFIQAVGAYLANRNIEGFNPGGRAVLSEAKKRATKMSLSREDRVVEALKENWNLPVISAANIMGALTGNEEAFEHAGREAIRLRSYMNQFYYIGHFKKTLNKKQVVITLYSIDYESSLNGEVEIFKAIASHGEDVFTRKVGVDFAEAFVDKNEL